MKKKYKHNTLPIEAEWYEDEKTTVVNVQVNLFWETVMRPVVDIKNSSDRKEICNRDWIDELVAKIDERFFYWTNAPCEDREMRAMIEKYAPKTKFTTDELKIYQQSKRDTTDPYYHIFIFCKDYWLLSPSKS